MRMYLLHIEVYPATDEHGFIKSSFKSDFLTVLIRTDKRGRMLICTDIEITAQGQSSDPTSPVPGPSEQAFQREGGGNWRQGDKE